MYVDICYNTAKKQRIEVRATAKKKRVGNSNTSANIAEASHSCAVEQRYLRLSRRGKNAKYN